MSLYLKRATVIFLVMLFAVLYLINTLYKRDFKGVFSQKAVKTVVIDAGHGAPDGGAVASDGTCEAEINLEIAKKLSAILKERCYNVIMTREAEEGIYEVGETVREKKLSDMKKRERIMNGSGADIFVSIHMNKFGDPKVHGAQVFYSENSEGSEKLALSIQRELSEIDIGNERVHKAADKSIYLMKHAEIPAVIAECGFLSNDSDLERLKDDEYRKKIVEAIFKGIDKYFESEEKMS